MERGMLWMLALSGVAMGCTAQVTDDSEVGALSLALRQNAANGEVYRLHAATLTISGAADQTLTPADDEAALQVELAAGEYALALEPGFSLQRQDASGWTDVAASLVSDNPQPFSIAAGELTTLMLRFALDDDTPVELVPGALEVQLAVDAAPPPGGCAPRLVINELDYDQEGTDTADFAEIFNAGGCAIDTTGLALVLLNGGTAGAPSYASIDLSAIGPSFAAGQYLVVGRPTLAGSLPAGTSLLGSDTFSIQNGSPDALRLEQNGNVLDALGYGGVIADVTEGASAPGDSGAGSLGRCPDGYDSGDNATDFTFVPTPTPGSPNACP